MLSRRKAMGAAVGGAIAGPQMVKEAASAAARLMQQVPTAMPPDYPYPKDQVQGQGSSFMDHLLAEKTRLEKVARGDFSDDRETGPFDNGHKIMAIEVHYQGLRSMSPAVRMLRIRDRIEEGRRAQRMWVANKRLDGILKQLAGLPPDFDSMPESASPQTSSW